ncbi:glycoside hydrolase family 43 protein [Neobacillus cucumis]|uniref:glycoside hydrolase family 43 protein n=1 Tax=Neobacillus cucumis TaxID=1740721 RepID=UPI001962D369|nr:glycoside hydrolase family 43 protein [Neobacillus cucumis]MBM7654952.1 xylan 1,4-beta-xylosidase [Neobacillus cucumis]
MIKIQNPILKGFNPDPSICRVGDDYYIATSTFEWFPGVQIHHSKDLVNWHLVSRPLNRVSLLDMKGNPNSGGVWAPSLSYSGGKFWLIYSDMKTKFGAWRDVHNYLTTCETIDGEWSEPIFLNSSGFDPSLFQDDDGRKYVVNRNWDQRTRNDSPCTIVLQEYSDAEKRLIGKPKVIFTGTDLAYTEGPNLYKINGYYYLVTAEGGTWYGHAATLARSEKIEGPYVLHPDNPLLSSWHDPRNPLQKCGHAAFVETQTNEWYMVHLTGRTLPQNQKPILDNRGFCPLGRETAIQKLEWRNGWPYVVGGKQGSLEVEAPNLEEVKWEKDYDEVDDFNSPILNHHFQSLRIPLTDEIMSLTDRPGNLRLYGRESLTSLFTQALVARRWQAFNFDASTGVFFKPDTFQQAAGLVCYYDTENWTSVQVTWNEEKGRIIDLVIRDHISFSRPLQGAEIQVPETVEYVHFKVKVREHTYQYYYSFDNETWIEIPGLFESYNLSDEHANGFTGAFVGMHCQDTSGARKAADFDYFQYKEL